MCVARLGARDTATRTNARAYAFVCLYVLYTQNMAANISVHIAVKGYVGAVTPTGKDRAVLLATF